MNLIEAIQAEQARLRDVLIPRYEEIGQAGQFGIVTMRASIAAGDDAIASGDIVAMLDALNNLKAHTD